MKEKLLGFIKENGFLLFLFVCVGVVAFSTIYVVGKDSKSRKEDLLTRKQIEDIPNHLNKKDIRKSKFKTEKKEIGKETLEKEAALKKGTKEEPKKEIPKVENLDSNKEKEESKPKEKVVTKKEEEAEEVFSQASRKNEVAEKEVSTKGFTMPVEGKVITEFSKDSLVYSETLDEWRAHNGIDIAAKLGTKVLAPLDGTVKEVTEDPLWGKLVVLDHGNGLLTKFANLGDTNMIKKGLSVKKGDHIAVVGKTADIEMLMESHLHFEAIKNGKSVDPRSIS